MNSNEVLSMFGWFVWGILLWWSLSFLSQEFLDIISWCALVHRISLYVHLSIKHLVRVCSFLLTLKSLCIKRWIRIGQDFMKSTNQWERQMCKGNYRVHSEYESTKSFETKRKKKRLFSLSFFCSKVLFFSFFESSDQLLLLLSLLLLSSGNTHLPGKSPWCLWYIFHYSQML